MKNSRVRASARKLTPSPSMLVAMIALVVALSGSAYAAVTINGKNIKKGTITSKQVKDKSLTGTDIKDKSVTGKDVKDASLTSADLAAGTIPTVPTVPGPEPIGTSTSTSSYSVPLAVATDIPGITQTYTVPAGANKIVAQFSGDCTVASTIDDQYVGIRILVDGVDANPTGYVKFCGPGDADGGAGNTGSNSKNTYESGIVTKTVATTPGTHTVKVQGLQILALSATLDNMTLVVQSGS
ncbi:MAG: hypothetical protein JHC98_08125 [Thermoleophilaceae bacterium]|nr:hypothetical protein [Thermoleophilaceae bacterium]